MKKRPGREISWIDSYLGTTPSLAACQYGVPKVWDKEIHNHVRGNPHLNHLEKVTSFGPRLIGEADRICGN